MYAVRGRYGGLPTLVAMRTKRQVAKCCPPVVGVGSNSACAVRTRGRLPPFIYKKWKNKQLEAVICKKNDYFVRRKAESHNPIYR